MTDQELFKRGLCLNCGGKVGPLKTAEGLLTRSADLHRLDPDGYFCRLRCAAEYGMGKARVAIGTEATK